MLELENDPVVEFAFFLALKLGRTVAELDDMPNDEFVKWIVYFEKKAHQQKHAAR